MTFSFFDKINFIIEITLDSKYHSEYNIYKNKFAKTYPTLKTSRNK